MSTKETNSTKHFFNHNDVFGQHSLNCMMSLRHIEKADNLYKKFKRGGLIPDISYLNLFMYFVN